MEEYGEYARNCIVCNAPYRAKKKKDRNCLCPAHYRDPWYTEFMRWNAALCRARRANSAATLTFMEWIDSIVYFGGKCAYCQDAPMKALEHFIPIKSGGATSADNCVPSCLSCNTKKEHYKKCTLPQRDIERVKAYLLTRQQTRKEE